jgi:hypothetical protein
MRALLALLGLCARFAFDSRFRRERDLDSALEDEGEDGPTVRRLAAEIYK